jgi:hypothetical protein
VVKKHFILKEPYIYTNISIVGLLNNWDIINNMAEKRSNLYN